MAGLSVSDARDTLSDIVNRVAYSGERVMLHRHGKAVAALVSAADLELLSALEDRIDLDDALKALKESGRKGAVGWSKIKSELDL
jgi:prevent-host-death family protein